MWCQQATNATDFKRIVIEITFLQCSMYIIWVYNSSWHWTKINCTMGFSSQ